MLSGKWRQGGLVRSSLRRRLIPFACGETLPRVEQGKNHIPAHLFPHATSYTLLGQIPSSSPIRSRAVRSRRTGVTLIRARLHRAVVGLNIVGVGGGAVARDPVVFAAFGVMAGNQAVFPAVFAEAGHAVALGCATRKIHVEQHSGR